MEETKSIDCGEVTYKIFIIGFSGYCRIPSVVVNVSDVSYGLNWTDDHSKS